ncbi:MAG: Swt1 family HEPN domain-containing protein [Microcoleaceae cyanobacterium MO_207.B10]|nr:Swt1 family HEPN domain-containing protein [Microcoleaceae cyanobacterium MO_207.B10]
MANRNNHEIINKTLNILNQSLYPYIESLMKEVYSDNWLKEAAETLKDEFRQIKKKKKKKFEEVLNDDVSLKLKLIKKQSDKVFKEKLGTAFPIVEELIEVRNNWAHGSPFTFSIDDTYRALDSITRLLKTIEAKAEVEAVEKEKQEVLRLLSQQQLRYETPHTPSVSPEKEQQIRKRLSELLEIIPFQDASL